MKLKWDFDELFEFGDRLVTISKYEEYLKKSTQELAKVLKNMLIQKTPVLTGTLKSGWENQTNNSYIVTQVNDGFIVRLENDATNEQGYRYGYDVNYGHYSYNQFGGPYEVKHRTVPYYDGVNAPTFVFGHFFVEKSVLELENRTEVKKIIEKELDRWFRWCLNG